MIVTQKGVEPVKHGGVVNRELELGLEWELNVKLNLN